MARSETQERGRLVHASIGIARPTNPEMYGYVSEHHGHGMTAEDNGEHAEDLAASMLASTLGIEFDPDAAWNERRQLCEIGHHIIGGASITGATAGDVAGRDMRYSSCDEQIMGSLPVDRLAA